MKKTSKIISLVLATMLCFTAFAPASFATEYYYEYLLELTAKAHQDYVSLSWYNDGNFYDEEINDGYSSDYIIDRKTSKDGVFEPIGRRDDWHESYKDYDVEPGKTYYYRIREGRYASWTKKVTVPYVNTPTLSIKVVGPNSIKLSWNKVEDADGYQIYRYNPDKDAYTLIKTINSGSTKSWINTGLKKGVRKYYKIRAFIKDDDGRKLCSDFSSRRYERPRNNVYITYPSYDFDLDEYGGPVIRTKSVYYSGGKIKYKALVLNNDIFHANKFNWVRIRLYDGDHLIASQKFYNKYIGLDGYDYKNMYFTFDTGTRDYNVNLRYSDIYAEYQYNYNYSY